MTLGELLKEEGRTQVWLRKQLATYGIVRDKSQICLWCSAKYIPRDRYVWRKIAEILSVDEFIIENCFTKKEQV